MTHNERKLREEILELSKADNFDEAKKEWVLVRIYKSVGECLCGHKPIYNLCVLRNSVNNSKAIVGSTCVQKFIGIKTEYLFESYKMISKDTTAYLSEELINYLYEHDIINEWEKEFLLSTIRKKFEWLSEKQKAKRVQINEKVIKYMEMRDKTYDDVPVYVKDLELEWWK